MSDPKDQENFLARWSRRKQEADTAPEPVAEKPDADVLPDEQKKKEEEPFDITKLPSIDSINAETDMKAFMQPGVPAELRHAALRRVWVTDPSIRDFVGLQENDWDFNKPGVPGFGPIGPEHNVAEMVARVFGDVPQVSEPPKPSPELAAKEQAVEPVRQSEPAKEQSLDAPSESDAIDSPQSESSADVAVQNEEAETVPRHGGALPTFKPKTS